MNDAHRGRPPGAPRPPTSGGGGGDAPESGGAKAPWTGDDDAVELEITDVLDLHTFAPREVPDLVRDYLDAAYERGFRQLRIIHGRGKGVQRRTVRTLLERDPRVVELRDAPGEGGGWGATILTMK